MREILFRGKSVKTGKWVFGHYFTQNEYHCIQNDGERPESMTTVVSPDTIGQYTGLVDRKGNKIFEGDIVAIGIQCKTLRFVKWLL